MFTMHLLHQTWKMSRYLKPEHIQCQAGRPALSLYKHCSPNSHCAKLLVVCFVCSTVIMLDRQNPFA